LAPLSPSVVETSFDGKPGLSVYYLAARGFIKPKIVAISRTRPETFDDSKWFARLRMRAFCNVLLRVARTFELVVGQIENERFGDAGAGIHWNLDVPIVFNGRVCDFDNQQHVLRPWMRVAVKVFAELLRERHQVEVPKSRPERSDSEP